MRRPRFLFRKRPGSPPGDLVHVGEKKTERIRLALLRYSQDEIEEKELDDIHEVTVKPDWEPTVSWLNIDGVHDVSVVRDVGTIYELHPLLLEDVLNTEHRPKAEPYEEQVFVILKMLYYREEAAEIEAEQVSLCLGSNFVVSFQESQGDVFEAVRNRIRGGAKRLRGYGADYLFYALIDAVVDHYFIVLDQIGLRIESLEEAVIGEPDQEVLTEIQQLKREVIFLRRAIWPLREALSQLLRAEDELITESTRLFLRDVYDHLIQAVDVLESFRDTTGNLLDIYLSTVGNRMNEVMKVLTIIATIFIPLTFIAGIYGMNFEYMPELDVPWAYPAVWVFMILIGCVMMIFFRRRGWL